MSTPADRLVVGLRPRTPEVEAHVARVIRQLAAEVADLDVVEAIAAEVEHPSGGLSASDLIAAAGLSYRQIHTWTTSGYLVPLDRKGTGSGHPFLYPPEAVLKARIMGSLVTKLHMTPGAASSTAEEILDHGRATVGPFVVTRRSVS